MPMGSACAVNPNDVMLGTHESHVHACQMFLNNIGALHFTLWAGMHECQPLTIKKLTASNNQVIITQNANRNMPKMVLVA